MKLDAVGAKRPLVPVSMRISFEPELSHDRRERNHHLVGALELIAESFLSVGDGEILEQSGREIRHPDTVIDGGNFKLTDLVAIEAGRLLASEGRCGAGRCGGGERSDGGGRGYGGGAGEQAAAGELGHGVSSDRRCSQGNVFLCLVQSILARS